MIPAATLKSTTPSLSFKPDQLAAQMHSRDAGSPYGTEGLDPCG